jgi:ELP3 family radical SAM enzyme/protein acetyltransferase
MDRITAIEEYARTMPTRHVWRDLTIPAEDYEIYKRMLYELKIIVDGDLDEKNGIRQLQRKYKRTLKPTYMTEIYLTEVYDGNMERSKKMEDILISARCRGISGVSVVTIFLSPYPEGQSFSCKWDCNYCPNEPGQPRSYLFGEPGVLRANQMKFDCIGQMYNRINAYKVNGHPTDKFEVLILGGTIHSYPKSYLEKFMTDMYYAANTCMDKPDEVRPKLSLAEEKYMNTNSEHRIIGVTVETRPDCVSKSELTDFRRWGVTRVQIGVQHTDDNILRAINRGCLHRHTMNAMKMLRANCFKVDIHLMPNLPTATPEGDMEMFDIVLKDMHPDQVKIYPCETTPFTKILDDFKSGKYVPYGNDDLTRVVLYWKKRVHPYIRNNRIIRDIPDDYVVAGVKTSSQRNEFQQIMKAEGWSCECMRCREAGRHPDAKVEESQLCIRHYKANGGDEYFLSYESADNNVLFGFCRLRFNDPDTSVIFPELENTALIRELHVYGRTFAVGRSASTAGVGNMGVAQHFGLGKLLMKEAEKIAVEFNYKKMAVISGVGVRNYYSKLGYNLDKGLGEFMMKNISKPTPDYRIPMILTMILIILLIIQIVLLLIKKFVNN